LSLTLHNTHTVTDMYQAFANMRPNSITLSRSQTWFPTWLSTSSCGSASLRPACDYFGSKAGRKQVRAISTSSVRVGPRPTLPLDSVMEYLAYSEPLMMNFRDY